MESVGKQWYSRCMYNEHVLEALEVQKRTDVFSVTNLLGLGLVDLRFLRLGPYWHWNGILVLTAGQVVPHVQTKRKAWYFSLIGVVTVRLIDLPEVDDRTDR